MFPYPCKNVSLHTYSSHFRLIRINVRMKRQSEITRIQIVYITEKILFFKE